MSEMSEMSDFETFPDPGPLFGAGPNIEVSLDHKTGVLGPQNRVFWPDSLGLDQITRVLTSFCTKITVLTSSLGLDQITGEEVLPT